jgi:hypothetical protein
VINEPSKQINSKQPGKQANKQTNKQSKRSRLYHCPQKAVVANDALVAEGRRPIHDTCRGTVPSSTAVAAKQKLAVLMRRVRPGHTETYLESEDQVLVGTPWYEYLRRG